MNQYYKICLRHMRQNDNVFMFWSGNAAGYTKCIENADLYEASEIEFEKQVSRGDFLVHKDIVEKLTQKIRLSMYGETMETYAGLNEFLVLPNTGQVRKELGITILDIKMKGSNNSFDAYFRDTVEERLKYEYSKTHFNVKGKKECFNEFWYYDTKVEATTRNEAITKAQKEWFLDKYSYIEFKKMVTCSRNRELVFDKWIKK